MSKSLRKKTRLGSFKFMSVLFSTTLSLFIAGLFGVIVIQAKTLTSIIRENIEIQVFLNKNISEADNAKIGKLLASKPYVLIKEGEGAQINYISADEAAASFLKDTGEDFGKFLDDNPLRHSYVISVREDFQTSEQMEKIVAEIQELNGVFEVTYMTDLVESINKNLVKVSMVLGAFILILIFTVIILINNTIRLALFSQRFLIRSMQLVGATKGFIRKPFLNRSFLYGALAGILASVILYALIEYTKANIDGFALLQNEEMLLMLFGSLVLLGAILSFFSTLRAVNKYLNMTLDELY
ncbi:permease-like cell division protein FtsX [Echinicola marina]|uniref:cell division protein FtsX n=1 Tax=Echinicola marina TaxID=2859768 RepID=UPI001CF66755|nr:permease-like cell division protein FtsX [Echinicola marina]UCS92701.1 permease-like cell division protein FtsX [Echinicola marina]